MWSGPRNLSTAMMYAFAARSDCAIWDEPYYAAYLARTGLDHPMRPEILATQDIDPDKISARILGSIPRNMPRFYQKHMTHHVLPEFDKSWMTEVINVFLVRHPARVVASYVQKRELPNLDDLGFGQQVALYDHAVALGQFPVVIDSADIRSDPGAALARLCNQIGLPFENQMLHWPRGGHADDGVWGAHWYGAVHQSTGFAGAEGPLPELSGDYGRLAAQALPYYRYLVDART